MQCCGEAQALALQEVRQGLWVVRWGVGWGLEAGGGGPSRGAVLWGGSGSG